MVGDKCVKVSGRQSNTPSNAMIGDFTICHPTADETFKLPLSVESAVTIEAETGCSAQWLKKGDPSEPPRSAILLPGTNKRIKNAADVEDPVYTKEVFDWVRSQKAKGEPVEPERPDTPDYWAALAIQDILLTCHYAKKTGKGNAAQVKLANLVARFCGKIGKSNPTEDEVNDYILDTLDAVHLFTNVDNRRK